MLHNTIHAIMSFFDQHPHIAVLGTFMVAFLEALPIVGTIIPGSVVMTAIGSLIGSGVIPASATLISATLGAFVGDCLGFAVGVRFQNNYRQLWPFSKYPKWMDASEVFFQKHGGKSVIIGRFIGPARSTVPMVAGLLKLSWPRFIAAAIPSAIFWVIAYILPGILLGAFALEIPFKESTHFIIYGLLVIAGLWFIYWVCQRSYSLIAIYLHNVCDHCWRWMRSHRHIQWLPQAIQLADHPNDSSQLLRLFSSAFFLLLFVILLIRLVAGDAIAAHLNTPLYYFLQSLRTSWCDPIMVTITAYGNTPLVMIMTLCFLISLIIIKQWRIAAYLFATLFVAAGITFIVKSSYTSLRPAAVLAYINENSFPSGHTVICVALYGFIAYITHRAFPQWGKKPTLVAVCIIILVIFSRLYLGAHWFTDILGGASLSTAVLIASTMLLRRRLTASDITAINPIYWGATCLISLVLIPSIYISTQYYKIQSLYQQQSPQSQSTPLESWWQQPIGNLPIARLNRFGKPIQPFNIQWSDNLDSIRTVLKNNGWVILSPNNTNDEKIPARARPNRLFPPLHLNQPAVLTAIYRQPNQPMIEMNLWATRMTLTQPSTPVWIGTISSSKPLANNQQSIENARPNYRIEMAMPHLASSNLALQQIKIPTTAMANSLKEAPWDGIIVILSSKTTSSSSQ